MKAGQSKAGLALTSCLLGIAVPVTVGECIVRCSPDEHTMVGYRAQLKGGVYESEREETAPAERKACLVIVFLPTLISVTRRFLGG